MARKVLEVLVDDIDGTEAVGTVRFSVGNKAYEIDLSEANTARFHEALAPFIEHASVVRTVGSRGAKATGSGSRRGRVSRADGPMRDLNPAEVRAWAARNGIAVSDRGRIPAAVAEQYRAAVGL